MENGTIWPISKWLADAFKSFTYLSSNQPGHNGGPFDYFWWIYEGHHCNLTSNAWSEVNLSSSLRSRLARKTDQILAYSIVALELAYQGKLNMRCIEVMILSLPHVMYFNFLMPAKSNTNTSGPCNNPDWVVIMSNPTFHNLHTMCSGWTSVSPLIYSITLRAARISGPWRRWSCSVS